jgi:exopolyphosphatase/pppGpp-phosphohydrolase
MSNRYNKLAIIDLGSARTKMLVASASSDGELIVQRYKEETGIAGKLKPGDLITVDAKDVLFTAIENLLKIAANSNCDATISVATDTIRSAVNAPIIKEHLNALLGHVTILDPSTEGLIFYSSMANHFLSSRECFCLVDVGGGSVQIIWGASAEEVVSIPTGTFRLEKEFQVSGHPTDEIYSAMASFIESEVKQSLPSKLRVPTLVFGSNCIEEFIKAALTKSNIGFTQENKTLRISLLNIRKLFEEIKSRRYEELGDYYPDNPFFMFGADKALLNVLVIGRLLTATSVIPTNESVSTGIARLGLFSSHLLENFGLELHQLH